VRDMTNDFNYLKGVKESRELLDTRKKGRKLSKYIMIGLIILFIASVFVTETTIEVPAYPVIFGFTFLIWAALEYSWRTFIYEGFLEWKATKSDLSFGYFMEKRLGATKEQAQKDRRFSLWLGLFFIIIVVVMVFWAIFSGGLSWGAIAFFAFIMTIIFLICFIDSAINAEKVEIK